MGLNRFSILRFLRKLKLRFRALFVINGVLARHGGYACSDGGSLCMTGCKVVA